MRPDVLHFYLTDVAATEILGRSLGVSCPLRRAPVTLHLEGDLGAGKTTCARSLLHCLGVTGPVRSPTYTLVDTYSVGSLTLIHVDLYRLQSCVEVEELGLRDLSAVGTLLVIEWPEHGATATPPADLSVRLAYGVQGRSAAVQSHSELGLGWLTELKNDPSLGSYVSNLT